MLTVLPPSRAGSHHRSPCDYSELAKQPQTNAFYKQPLVELRLQTVSPDSSQPASYSAE
jgi:hypothetical protein